MGDVVNKPVERVYRLSCGHVKVIRSVAPFPRNTTTVCPDDQLWTGIEEEVTEGGEDAHPLGK
jgi:hypothetical protein